MRTLSRPSARLLAAAILLTAIPAFAQKQKITPPKIGQYTVGDDYFLANYTQLLEYWNKLARESNRMKLTGIGRTAEGRPMVMAIITSPENHRKLARYKEISQRLARAEGLTEDQARALAAEGRAVVWIDGGLHATECINAQALFIEAYDLLSRSDPETMRILNEVILLLVPVNPDGMELVSNWYMRESDPKKRNMAIPRLYQKYVGHDNNRDSYMMNQPETEAANRQLYIEWIPQIMYNQHQTGPAGTVLFFAPFRNPFNYNQDPLVPIGIDLVSAAVHHRFLTEGKPGAVMRSAANYSTWFSGGSRTTVGFHNQIGLLSEIIGNPTPASIPLVSSKLLPDGDQPAPIGPRQEWHQRQSIEYVLSADRAILDLAAKLRQDFLFRIWRAGMNSIERGNRDHWTLTPKRIAALEAAYAKDQGKSGQAETRPAEGPPPDSDSEAGFMRARGIPVKYWDLVRSPEARDPRGYIVPSDQPDFPTATRFINILIKGGVGVHQAKAAFQVAGKSYPAGSYVVKAAQAFRPHLRDMFEPQDHPNDFLYPGGPPRRPYDVTGYTLAFQMGVEFDRILDAFDGPFEKVPGVLKPPAGKVSDAPAASGYLIDHRLNDAFVATTRLLKAGEDVFWLRNEWSAAGRTWAAGTLWVPARASTAALLKQIASESGLSAEAVSSRPAGEALKLRPVRIGLWDRYGGSMESGHMRWMLEQAFPVPFEVVFAPALDAGSLRSKYDVLIFPAGGLPSGEGGRGGFGGGPAGGAASRSTVPPEYKDQVGSVTLDKTGPQLKRFLEDGGTIIAIGRSTGFSEYLKLPVTSALVDPEAKGRRLSSDKFYIPGSILQATVNTALPIAWGLPSKLDVFYNNSPAFRLQEGAEAKGVRPIAWYDSAEPLRSGWAWGQRYLKGAVAAVEAAAGQGRIYLFGPEITFRAQPHGTFKFLFNGIYLAGAETVSLP